MTAGADNVVWTRRRRDLAYQIIALLAVFGFVALIVATASNNLADRGIEAGTEFLGDRAGFSLSETWLPYSPDDSNLWAIAVGVGNTLVVAGLVSLYSTILGLFLGIARISENPLAAGLSKTWVEIARNSPPILILLFLYSAIGKVLPVVDTVELLPHILVSQRGFALPWLSHPGSALALAAGGAAAVALLFLTSRAATRAQQRTGHRPPWLRFVSLAIGGVFLSLVLISWQDIKSDLPVANGPDISGGIVVSPEFFSLIVGLTFYTTGFVAEIIRTGLLSVPRGQWEAGYSIGLSRWRTLRLVVIPQMLRVIIPPMTSQYINIVKNSTLVIAIGYADFMVVMGTMINKTSHAIEGTLIIIATYLLINLSLSALMSRVNRVVQVVER